MYQEQLILWNVMFSLQQIKCIKELMLCGIPSIIWTIQVDWSSVKPATTTAAAKKEERTAYTSFFFSSLLFVWLSIFPLSHHFYKLQFEFISGVCVCLFFKFFASFICLMYTVRQQLNQVKCRKHEYFHLFIAYFASNRHQSDSIQP